MTYENLFNYMAKEHGLNLLQEEMQEIERMVELDKDGSNCNLPHVSKRVGDERRTLLFAFIKEWKEEFKDENWDYLDFMAERFLSKQ